MFLSSVIGAAALFAASVTAAPSAQFARQAGCKFDSFASPGCWDGVHDLKTDYYTQGPKNDPKKPRVYNFTLSNVTTLAPDGVPRSVLAINGQVPGPTIYADWGDTVGEFSNLNPL